MGTLEIVIGAVLLLISLVTIIICMMQEQKPQNATADRCKQRFLL